MKAIKIILLSLLVLISSCQEVTVTNETIVNSTSSGASAACWQTTLQGKCNKQRRMFAKFKVSDQESVCSIFEVKTDGCYFKTDSASVEKINALKDETLKKLTDAVNKYVSDRFIKVQAKMLKAQEKNSSKVNLSSVNQMSDVTQRSSILAKKIFVNSIRKAYEAIGLKPADLSKVTAEATVSTTTSSGNRFLAEAEIEALIVLPTLEGILEIQDELENYDDVEVEFQAESEQSLAIIIAEKEVENMMVDKKDITSVSKENSTKLQINLENLKNRFTVNSSTNVDLNTLKNDKNKFDTKANSEAKKLCESTLESSKQMCNGDSLCVDIALATCSKETKEKMNAIANSNTTTNISFSQIVEEAKKDQMKIADMVKQSNTKLNSNASLNSSKSEIKNEFELKLKTEESINKGFQKSKDEYESKKNTILDEIKASLNNQSKMPKELENLFTNDEKSLLVKNTIKDETKASIIIGQDNSSESSASEISKDILKEQQKQLEQLLKDNKNTLTKEQQAQLELALNNKGNQNLTKEQQKAIEESNKILEESKKNLEQLLKDNKGLENSVKDTLQNLPDLIKSGANAQINSNLNISGKTRVLQNLTSNAEATITTTNVESNTSIALDNVPYSYTISSLLGCTKEAAVLNNFLDNTLPLTVDSSTNAELSKEIIRLTTIVRAMPYPKINRLSPKYEDLLCSRKFNDYNKVKEALEEIEKAESACFMRINNDGVKTCNKTIVEKNNSSENNRAKDSTVTIICNKGTCVALYEVGANISLYIKGQVSFDLFTAQRKIISQCLNNSLSTEECCHTNGYSASQKEIAKARMLNDKTSTKERKICHNEKREIKSFYKAFLTLSIPGESTDFDELVKNIFEGIDVSAKIKVKGRLLSSDQLYLSGSDSNTYSTSNSGLKSENDSQYAVAGSTPSNRATYEQSLETTMNVQAGMELTTSNSKILKMSLSLVIMMLILFL